MPVRLLVREEQADEARRILETTAQAFKDLASISEPGSSLYQAYFSPARNPGRQNQMETWNSAQSVMDKFEYDRAAEIVQRLINKNPNYYYGYAFLGYISLEQNRLKEAIWRPKQGKLQDGGD